MVRWESFEMIRYGTRTRESILCIWFSRFCFCRYLWDAYAGITYASAWASHTTGVLFLLFFGSLKSGLAPPAVIGLDIETVLSKCLVAIDVVLLLHLLSFAIVVCSAGTASGCKQFRCSEEPKKSAIYDGTNERASIQDG